MLWAKSSLTRTSHAPACVSASSISTPGITGKWGKWSAKYSSVIVNVLTAVIRTHGSSSIMRSISENRMGSRKDIGLGKRYRAGQIKTT